METVPALLPPPAVVDRSKPVVIKPPEVSSAHDFTMIAYILTLILTIPWLIILGVIAYYGVLNALYLYGYGASFFLPPTIPASISGIPFLGPFIAFLVFVLTPSYITYLALGGGGLLILIIFVALVYFTTVRNVNKGRYEKARNASLFWGVIFLLPSFFVILSPILSGSIVGILPAFFFLLAWGRLSEVIAKYGPVAVLGEAVPGAPFAGPPGPPPPMGMPIPPPMGGPPIAAPIGGPMPGLAPGPMPLGGPMPGGPGQMPPSQPTGPASKIPLCPTCGKELYYAANHRRWYCQTCDNPGTH
jgi:hypothetical protein